MERRSRRLLEAGYYTVEGTPYISYREVFKRIFSRRRARHYIQHDLNSLVNVADQGDVGSDAPEMPHTTTRVISETGTQTRGHMVCCFSVKNVGCFLLLLLLAFGLTHVYLELGETLQEVQSLRQRIDMFVTLADTIPNFALESQGARVLHDLSTDTYWPYNYMGLVWERLFYRNYSPKKQRQTIQGQTSLRPGQCWCFSGDSGHLFISLSHPVSITHVTL